MSWSARLAEQAQQRRAQARLRRIEPVVALPVGRVERGGRVLLEFSSNDYLGLARDPRQAEVLAAAARAHGAGAGAAHAVSGHHPEHERLQAELADWLQRPAVLLCSSGWSAALGCLGGLLQRGDACLQDRLNHACLLDGARLAGARLSRYRHLDADHAGKQLQALGAGALALLVTDGVFSMDGDVAPLPQLAADAAEHDSWLMVDEAHALGVLGPDGAGSAAAVGLDARQVPILMGTFGKALGGWGAFIAGSVELIEHLQHTARPWLFSTALPAAWATLCRSAVARVRRETALREQLQARIAQFRDGAAELGLSRPPLASNDSGDERIGLLPSDTPIQPFLLGSEARALTWEAALADAGLAVKAIRPPTVPAGQSRLRIALSAGHSPEQIEQLLGALARLRDSEAQA
ncbi:MAG: 8-amino-7-oxononanoate synthase [Xanthomonadales bacterium]|nr:8-amino-7-oxononanoate synthase [Xanthomonadales bacterium]